MESDKVESVEALDVVVLSENLVRSTHRIGSVNQQRVVRTLTAPNLGGRTILAVHVQPRGGNDGNSEAFAVRVAAIVNTSPLRANVLIARADADSGWAVDLYIDALWVTS